MGVDASPAGRFNSFRRRPGPPPTVVTVQEPPPSTVTVQASPPTTVTVQAAPSTTTVTLDEPPEPTATHAADDQQMLRTAHQVCLRFRQGESAQQVNQWLTALPGPGQNSLQMALSFSSNVLLSYSEC